MVLAGGQRLEWVLAYVAQPPGPGVTAAPRLDRSPLLVNGEMVTVAEVSQDDACTLSGESAPGDGLDVIDASGAPTGPTSAPDNSHRNYQSVSTPGLIEQRRPHHPGPLDGQPRE